MPTVIGKARNDVLRAPKPVREVTLRASCRVTRRSCGMTTPRSSCLAAHPAESASRPCGLTRWVLIISEGRAVHEVQGIRCRNRFKSIRFIEVVNRHQDVTDLERTAQANRAAAQANLVSNLIAADSVHPEVIDQAQVLQIPLNGAVGAD